MSMCGRSVSQHSAELTAVSAFILLHKQTSEGSGLSLFLSLSAFWLSPQQQSRAEHGAGLLSGYPQAGNRSCTWHGVRLGAERAALRAAMALGKS